MDLQPSCTGLSQTSPADPCLVVIFGASGDLARNMLIPSLYALRQNDLLPKPFAIVGFARREWDDRQFREQMQVFAKQQNNFDSQQWDAFARDLFYISGDFTDSAAESLGPLRDRIRQLQHDRGIPGNLLFHLSTPPRFYGEIVRKLEAAGILAGEEAWRRVVIEKPFGEDEASARELDRELLEVLDEESLYRVDHFLGKETVQNMLVFRFANPGFEPIWNHQFIDHVQISGAESEGIGTRAGYYDKSGVVRDMIQNHLLQLLCMTAMEPPVSYDGTSLRNETVKVLQSIHPPDVDNDWVLGQYVGGRMADGREVAGYREEENVPQDSQTPTFAALRLHIDNWRWAGVPFYLRTGKRMPRKVSAITIHFKPTPHLMFPLEAPEHLRHSVLTFRLQPDEGIVQTILAKQPGPGVCLQPVTLTFRYDKTFGIEHPPSAYQWLLHDAMHGDQTLFPRSDWIYRAWSLVDPIVRRQESDAKQEIARYEAGSWGPKEADELLRRDERIWEMMC